MSQTQVLKAYDTSGHFTRKVRTRSFHEWIIAVPYEDRLKVVKRTSDSSIKDAEVRRIKRGLHETRKFYIFQRGTHVGTEHGDLS